MSHFEHKSVSCPAENKQLVIPIGTCYELNRRIARVLLQGKPPIPNHGMLSVELTLGLVGVKGINT